jgi:hypothetical protein
MLAADGSMIVKVSSGTSVVVVNRHHYLSLGGQDESFEGWGYEDYEFNTRLTILSRWFPMPIDWLSMAGNFITISEFKGWKAVYRLHGDWLANKGIYLFHQHHQTDSDYRAHEPRNLDRLTARMKSFHQSGETLAPIPIQDAGITLILRDDPFCFDRKFAPELGQVIFRNASEFESTQALSAYLQAAAITRVMFPNPYATPELLALYRMCSEEGIETYVCERGALPDSVYHDPSGFLSDGESYTPKQWDHPLSEAERSAVEAYITEVFESSRTLEQQSSARQGAEVRRRLGVAPGRKIVFVPFQQPGDTVVQHFAGECGSWEVFVARIEALATGLGRDWAVVVKKHPAEESFEEIPGTIAAHHVHIYDLIEIADSIVVLNSGTGLLGAMAMKPVFTLGEAFYGQEGLCRRVGGEEDLAKAIASGFSPDREKLLRFVHYLRFHFYSFGQMEQRKTKMANGRPITATRSINYYELRAPGGALRRYNVRSVPVDFASPLFDRYRNRATPLVYAGVDCVVSIRAKMASKTHNRKLRKFFENPQAFFQDSKFLPLRALKIFFSAKSSH